MNELPADWGIYYFWITWFSIVFYIVVELLSKWLTKRWERRQLTEGIDKALAQIKQLKADGKWFGPK
jgi:membrane protein implicated in regulation of membrane protease activity